MIAEWKEGGLAPGKLDGHDFGVLEASEELCEGVRVVLTQNL